MSGESSLDQPFMAAPSTEQVATELQALRRTLRRLVVLTALLTLAVFLLAAVVFGYLVNYFSFEPLLVGAGASGSAVLGFLVGLIAGRRSKGGGS